MIPIKSKIARRRPPTVSKSWSSLRFREELVFASVQDRIVADVPVGIFLSGGLDSSLIAAFALYSLARPRRDQNFRIVITPVTGEAAALDAGSAGRCQRMARHNQNTDFAG